MAKQNMKHDNPIHTFVKALVNSRGFLLSKGIGNTSNPVRIKHERLKKDFDYACSIATTPKGWIAFLAKHEATCKEIMLGEKSKQRQSLEEKFNKAFYYAIKIKI